MPATESAPGSAPRRRAPILDTSFFVILLLLAGLMAVAWWQGGLPQLTSGLGDGVDLLVRYGLVIVVAFLAAGLAQALVPREAVEGILGEQSGMRGLLVATAGGMLTPSGPFVSMPIAAALLKSGASPGAVAAYVSAWSLLAVHRFVAWEVPVLGFRFAFIRWSACLLLPVLAGVAVQAFKRFLTPPT